SGRPRRAAPSAASSRTRCAPRSPGPPRRRRSSSRCRCSAAAGSCRVSTSRTTGGSPISSTTTRRSLRCADVNVLVYAHRPEAPRHEEYRAWLELVRADDEPLGLIDVVLSGFLRVVTNPRVFREPTPLPIALEFIRHLRDGPSA